MDDNIDMFKDTKYVSFFDGMSGYWQLAVDKDSQDKTAVISEFGLFNHTVLPFGV